MMGKIEDILVYTKIVILLVISGLLVGKGNIENIQPFFESSTALGSKLIVSAITFVAYEGFQLVIHAYDEMDAPQKNIPRPIYYSIGIAILIYVILSVSALATIPKEVIIEDKEFSAYDKWVVVGWNMPNLRRESAYLKGKIFTEEKRTMVSLKVAPNSFLTTFAILATLCGVAITLFAWVNPGDNEFYSILGLVIIAMAAIFYIAGTLLTIRFRNKVVESLGLIKI